MSFISSYLPLILLILIIYLLIAITYLLLRLVRLLSKAITETNRHYEGIEAKLKFLAESVLSLREAIQSSSVTFSNRRGKSND